MQTKTQICELLQGRGLAPSKTFGQNFLIDLNLMAKLLELADLAPSDVVLEVGPGTGSLTEELAVRAARVVAVEIDRGLHALLADRFAGKANVTFLHADALAGKHKLEPRMVAALGPRARLVSNLPYSAATPLVIECLLMSWRAQAADSGLHHEGTKGTTKGTERLVREKEEDAPSATSSLSLCPSSGPLCLCGDTGSLCLLDRLTFTVQREVADRMAAGAGEGAYGPLSVIVAALGRLTAGPVVPASAFWPVPNVASRIVRIDFDRQAATRLADAETFTRLLSAAFGQRRKQLGSLLNRKDSPFAVGDLEKAMERAGIDPRRRAEEIDPPQFVAAANALCAAGTLS